MPVNRVNDITKLFEKDVTARPVGDAGAVSVVTDNILLGVEGTVRVFATTLITYDVFSVRPVIVLVVVVTFCLVNTAVDALVTVIV